MNLTNHKTARVQDGASRWIYALVLVFVLIGLGTFLIYRSGVFLEAAQAAARLPEVLWLVLCAIFLAAIFAVMVLRLLQLQAGANLMRSSLAQNEAQLRGLIQAIPDMIWLKDPDGVYMGCNPAFERFFGEQEDDIIGKTDYDFVEREMADSFRTHDQAAIAADRPHINEEWVTMAEDGREVFLETIKVPVKTDDNRLVGVLGVSRDITRRYEAEKKAMLYRNLIELSGDPIYVLDMSDGYRMTFVNQAACQHFGLPREEILKMRVYDWDPDITEQALEEVNEKFKLGESVVLETRHSTALGEIVPVEISSSLLHQNGRRLAGGYIRNIYERKRSEEALQQYQEQLRQLLAHQDRIREDERKRIAREIHDDLGQYLLAMRIDVSMLSGQGDNAVARPEHIDNILHQIDGTMKKVRSIINNLRPSVLDLGLFAALEWQLKEFSKRSGITYQLSGNEESLRVDEAVATSLFRVMQEALTNIQRHAQASHVKVDLHREGDYLVMLVADNGVGMQADAIGAERFGLIGIRERMAMLGGEVAIESRDGTVLSISIPILYEGSAHETSEG